MATTVPLATASNWHLHCIRLDPKIGYSTIFHDGQSFLIRLSFPRRATGGDSSHLHYLEKTARFYQRPFLWGRTSMPVWASASIYRPPHNIYRLFSEVIMYLHYSYCLYMLTRYVEAKRDMFAIKHTYIRSWSA